MEVLTFGSGLPECMIPLVLGCKQVVLVGDHQVSACLL